jgi:hypothetical protein
MIKFKVFVKATIVIGAILSTGLLYTLVLRSFGALPAVQRNQVILEQQRSSISRLQSEVDSLKWEVRKHAWQDRKEN